MRRGGADVEVGGVRGGGRGRGSGGERAEVGGVEGRGQR